MSTLGFEERFALLVDRQWLWKENRALARRLRSARLKELRYRRYRLPSFAGSLTADGSIGRVLLKISRIDVLLLDDFAMAPMKDAERRDFL